MSTSSETTNDGNVQATNSPQYIQIMQRLGGLEEALIAQDPKIKDHLKEIHRLMIGHEELVHLLKPEEIAKIMQGQQIITNTVLVAATTGTGKKASSAKKATGLGLDDL